MSVVDCSNLLLVPFVGGVAPYVECSCDVSEMICVAAVESKDVSTSVCSSGDM